jgi:hypothetical protein
MTASAFRNSLVGFSRPLPGDFERQHNMGQDTISVGHATTDAVTDTGASGHILSFANEVYDADDKNKIGTDQGICFRTVPGKAWECFWTLSLDKGQLTVEGPFYDSGYSVLAITGGTGEFCRRARRNGFERSWHQR